MTAHLLAARLLAADSPRQASSWGLLVIVVLLGALVLLYRSMSKHVRRVPASFEEPSDDAPDDAAQVPAARTDADSHPSEGGSTAERPAP